MVLVNAPAFGDDDCYQKSKVQTVYAGMQHKCLNPFEPGFPIPWWQCTWSDNTRPIIRNVDLEHSITVTKIYFHGPDGELIYEVLE